MGRHAKALTLLLAIPALGLGPSRSAAAADLCWDQCVSTCRSGNDDYCSTRRVKCSARCAGRRWWGAIAYSNTDGSWGASWGWTEVAAAKKRAMDRCIAHQGAACKVWTTFEDECGAVAADGAIAAWGTAFPVRNAMQRAVLECQKAGGRNCRVQASACSKMMEVTDAY